MNRLKTNRIKHFLILTTFLVIFVFGLLQCSDSNANTSRFLPSGNEVYLPSDRLVSFDRYIQENQFRIKNVLETLYSQDDPFLGKFDSETILNFRSPEQDLPSSNCLARKDKYSGFRMGFLFLHGLTDSPFSLKETKAKIKKAYPCATFRSSIMTGHGTIPGDADEVSYEEWIEMVDYSLHQFLGEVDQVFIVGYSTGFTLALEQLQNEGNTVQYRNNKFTVSGVIGLSPALRTTSLAMVAPVLKYFMDYLDTYPGQDPVKYESLNLNLVAQFYKLTQKIDLEKSYDLPVFMAVSSDDTTVDPVINYDFYCKNLKSKEKRMIWYQGLKNILTKCEGMEVIATKNSEYSLENLSHVSIPFSVENSVYGFEKKYPHCLSYYHDSEKISFTECQKNQNEFIYGEENLLENKELLEGKFFRRATFNPYFDHLMEKVVEFIDTNKI